MTAPQVVLVGPMGVGKSTVGQLLAERLGVGYRDTDDDIVAAQGRTIAEIFVDEGEPAFRAIEKAAVHRALAEHNGVLALGPTGATPAIAAIKQLNLNSKIKLATFDLSKDVLNSIKAGDMLFAIDQQQYLQGYLPIVFLTYNNLYGLAPGGGQPVLTGPGIVDKTNVDKVIANTGSTR